MKNLKHNLIVGFWYVVLLLACGGLYNLAMREMIGLIAFPLFAAGYSGAYLTCKKWPNPETININDYPAFVKGGIFLQMLMGVFLLIGFCAEQTTYKVRSDYNTGLTILSVLLLALPWLGQKANKWFDSL